MTLGELERLVPLFRPGWFVFKRARGTMGHYAQNKSTLRLALCRGRLSFTKDERPWDVTQDVGRVPLCEACKAKLRAV